jgi:hypothetical protein
MNKCFKKNLRSRIGDILIVKGAGDIPYLKYIHILPIEDTIKGITGNLT